MITPYHVSEFGSLYHGDCLSVMAEMADKSVDLTVTSPPYDNLRDYNGYSFDFESIAKELFRITKQGGVVVWVVGDATVNGSETGTSFRQALYFKEIGFNLHDTMIYYRVSPYPDSIRYQQAFEYMFVFSNGVPMTFNPHVRTRKSHNSFNHDVKSKTYRDKQGNTKKLDENGVARLSLALSNKLKASDNVWYEPAGYMVSTKDIVAFDHPAIFPEQLAFDHIKSWSNEGDTVFDCFMGSGTVAKMAIKANRKYIGAEISAEYCEISAKRIDIELDQTDIFRPSD